LNTWLIIFQYLKKRWLHTLLNVLLLSLGIAIIIFLLLVHPQIQKHFWKNTQGIKMVIGAKGSPLQLILSSVYHTANPTGNISLQEAKKIQQKVKNAIPISLGDNWEGFRIVGTSHQYPKHYQVQLQQGKLWEKPLQAVIGSEVAKKLNVKIGQQFVGGHGLDKKGHSHEDKKYTIVGILAPSYSVLDKLILTDLASVWLVHEEHHEEKEDKEEKKDSHKEHEHKDGEEHTHENEQEDKREITALLITQFANQMQAINLPRIVNKETNMMAAQPVTEIQNLFDALGLGEQILHVLAYIIISMAILSIFIALYDTLKNRKYDLALMRALGASKIQIFGQVILEGFLLTFLGGFLGVMSGHLLAHWIGSFESIAEQMYITGFFWANQEWYVILSLIPLAFFTSLIPAFQTYYTQPAAVLKE
jgi:putative ABC transport system permease protein